MAYENDSDNMANADISNVEAVAQTVADVYDGLAFLEMGMSEGFERVTNSLDDIKDALIDVVDKYQMLEQMSNSQTYVSGTGNTGFVMSASISAWNLDRDSESRFEASITRAIQAAIGGANASVIAQTAVATARETVEEKDRPGRDKRATGDGSAVADARRRAQEMREEVNPDESVLGFDEHARNMRRLEEASAVAGAQRQREEMDRRSKAQAATQAAADEISRATQIFAWGKQRGYFNGDMSAYTIDEINSMAGADYDAEQRRLKNVQSALNVGDMLMTPGGLQSLATAAGMVPDMLLGNFDEKSAKQLSEALGGFGVGGMTPDVLLGASSLIRGVPQLAGSLGSIADAKSAGGVLGGMGSIAGSIPQLAGSLGSILGSTATADAAGVGLAGLLEGLGMTEAAGALGTFGAAIGPAMAVAAPWLLAASVALPLAGQAIDFLSDEKKQESFFTQLTTGMSEEDVSKVQNSLTGNGLKFGSDRYKQGFGWITDAVQNRKVGGEKLTTDQAIGYYEDMVIKGGMSIAQLNDALDTLSDTVENTNLSLDDVNANIKTMSTNLKSAYGGNALLGQQGALAVQDYFTAGTGQGGLMASGVAGNYDFGNDVRAIQTLESVMQANTDIGYDEAVVLASFQMAGSGYLPGADKFLAQPMIRNGKPFFQYVQEGDWDGLAEAVDIVWNYDESRGAYGAQGRASLIRAMKSIGVPDTSLTSPDALVSYMKNDIGTGLSDMASGESSAVKRADAADREKGNWYPLDNRRVPARRRQSVSSASSSLERAMQSGDYDGEDNVQSVMTLLNDAGIVSSDTKLTETGATETAERLMEVYEEEGRSEGTFQEWLSTDAGRQAATSVVDRYASLNSGEGASSSTTNVNVEIRMRDEASRWLYANWQTEDEQATRDSGHTS